MRKLKLISTSLTILILVCYIAILAVYQKSLDKNAIPWHDGSHHFTLAANLFNHLSSGDFEYYLESLRNFPELILTYSILNLAFLLVGGVKQAAIPFVYTLFFILIVLSYFLSISKRERHTKSLLFTIVFILSGIYTTQAGGALDTRVDILSASAGAISLLFITSRNFYFGILFFLFASFLKGAAFFLILPMLLIGIAIEYLKEKITLDWNLKFLLKSISIAIPLLIFFKVLLASVLSYNLMQTGGSNLESRVQIFISNVNQYLIGGFGYYYKVLKENTNVVFIFLGIILAVLYSIWQKNKKLILSGFFVFFCISYSYVLMTMSPLKSGVLIIWFLPCTIVASIFFTDFIFKIRYNKYLILALLSITFIVLYKIPRKYNIPEDYLQLARNNIHQQASEIAIQLDEKYPSRFVKGVVFVNFLSAHGVISYNYDSYTNLIHKKVKKAKIDLAGWELATYSKEWKKEIERFKDYDLILLILQEEPMGIPATNTPQKYGREVYLELEKSRKEKPSCFTKITNTIDLPHIGKRDTYLFSNVPDCKAILFP